MSPYNFIVILIIFNSIIQHLLKLKVASATAMERKMNATMERLLMECEKSTGLTQAELQVAMPHVSIDELVYSINHLLQQNRLRILQSSFEIFYKTVDVEEAAKLKGLDPKQLVVYRLVEQEGASGIWKKTLRERSCIAVAEFPKILKVLENKRLIKRFKSVTAKNKVFFIVANLEPKAEHTGGIFFDSSTLDLDVEFINVLSNHCYHFILQKGSASLLDVTEHIASSGIATIEISKEDIQKLLYTLELDAKIESFIPTGIAKFNFGNPEVYYRPTRLKLKPNGLTNCPCSICPVSGILQNNMELRLSRYSNYVLGKDYEIHETVLT